MNKRKYESNSTRVRLLYLFRLDTAILKFAQLMQCLWIGSVDFIGRGSKNQK